MTAFCNRCQTSYIMIRLLCLFPLLIAAQSREAAVVRLPAEIDLSIVTDRSELSFDEGQPYFGTLEHVRDVPADDLRNSARQFLHQRWESAARFAQRPEAEFPLFVDMIENPSAYRGRPVTLSGHLIRMVKSKAGPNEHAIETLYEGWLVTDDSQQHPVTIICTDIPSGMPIGEETIDGVSVTGYFLKLRTYPSRDRKIRFAPLILAHSMDWRPVTAKKEWDVSPSILYGGIMLCTIACLLTMWFSARRHKLVRDARRRESIPDNPPEFLESLNP